MADTSDLSTFWNTAREEVGSRREDIPDSRDPTAKVYTERWSQALSAYVRPARGTEHATKSGYYFVDDRELELREDLKTWERIWATIPATRSEPITTSYTYPGYINERDPVTLGVAGRVLLEYFLNLDPTNASTGIAIEPAQRYTNTYGDIMVLNDGGAGLLATTPTLTAYKALVSGGSEINAADSEREQYMGDIWCRKTVKIPAR
jgi:hypothetical protein